MAFVKLSEFLRLDEGINEVTAKYSELVTIAKEFETLIGEKELKKTGLMNALKKLNELIIDFKGDFNEPAEKETQHAQPDEDDVQPIQPLQPVQFGKTQPAQPIQFGKTQPPRKGINRALQNDLPI